MKNVVIIILSVLCLPFAGKAQINLVLNPNFESYSTCPDNADEAKYCNHWMSLDSAWNPPDWSHDQPGVPEYCNVCATYGGTAVPHNNLFYNYPHSGNGMMQLTMFSTSTTSTYVRDYLQGHLSQTLIAGHRYNVQFYTTLEQGGGYAVNGLGAYLDDGTIDTTQNPGIVQNQYTPQIVDTSIINTNNWVKIEDTFTSNGTEKLITIGQFRDNYHTNFVTTTGGTATSWAFYLIDDVSVIDCSNVPFAGRDTTLVTPTTDSVFLGVHESLLPYTWYVLDSTNPIDSGGGIWVHPAVNTSYVLVQKLCGITKTDTVTVHVRGVGINELTLQFDNLVIYPNPVTSELTIDGAKNCEISIYNIIGQQVLQGFLSSSKETINIEGLTTGMYLVQVTDISTGEKVTGKVLKE